MSFSDAVSYYVAILYREVFPCFNCNRVHVMSLKPRITILQHPLSIGNVVYMLHFLVRPVVIGLVIDGVTRFKYEGLDVFALRLC